VGRGVGRDIERDGAGISAGSDHEIVFELLLISVVNEIDTGIGVLVAHFRIVRDVGAPLTGIVAQEIVALAFLFVRAGDRGGRVSADEFHTQDSGFLALREKGGGLDGHQLVAADIFGRVSASQAQHSLIAGEEQGVSLAARKKLNLLIALALIWLETKRQFAVSLD